MPTIRCPSIPGLIAVTLSLLSSTAFSDSVTIEPDADTGLFELDPEINMGSNRDAPAGTLGVMGDFEKCRMLLRFDVSGAVPAGSTITGASIRMRVTRTPESGKQNSDFALFRMLVPWNEGTGIGDIPGGRDAVEGESTWSHRVFPDIPWGEEGGEEGTDYAAAESASARIFGNGEYVFNFSPTGVSDLQSMLEASSANYGWMFLTKSEELGKTARRFGTRENNTAGYRPRLEITYEPPSAPPNPQVIESAISNSGVMIRFLTETGIEYVVESTRNLEPEAWTEEQTIPASESPSEAIFTKPLALGQQEFYRVRAQQ